MAAKDLAHVPSGRSIFGAAARSKEFFDHLEAHYRECRRKQVDIDAALTIVLDDGETYDKGEAKVKDVSPTGALLAAVKLHKDAFPTKPFSIVMKMLSGGYEGITFRCKPVRFVPDQHGIGVRFDEVYVDTEASKRKS
ncbi:MAG TPA: hypothetical protein ENN09_02090 [Planctomycetes bacterium]|nr:hypothetical protein [Planctomycetota bacterium]